MLESLLRGDGMACHFRSPTDGMILLHCWALLLL